MKTINPRPISQKEILKPFTSKNSATTSFSLFQLVREKSRPPIGQTIEIEVMGDASVTFDLPEGALTREDLMTRIYANDPERKKRDMHFQKRMFAGMARQVKAGTLNPIRFARIKAGLDQRELARKVGMSASNLARLEKVGTNPRLSTLRKIADALSITVEELVHE